MKVEKYTTGMVTIYLWNLYTIQTILRNHLITKVFQNAQQESQILLIDAREKNVIIVKDNLLCYNDNILGATDDSAINWLSNPDNAKLKGLIMRATYPQLYVKADTTVTPKDTKDTKKTK